MPKLRPKPNKVLEERISFLLKDLCSRMPISKSNQGAKNAELIKVVLSIYLTHTGTIPTITRLEKFLNEQGRFPARLTIQNTLDEEKGKLSTFLISSGFIEQAMQSVDLPFDSFLAYNSIFVDDMLESYNQKHATNTNIAGLPKKFI